MGNVRRKVREYGGERAGNMTREKSGKGEGGKGNVRGQDSRT